MNKQFLFNAISLPIRRIGDQIGHRIPKRFFGLGTKITFLILLNVTGVLLLSSFLDFHLLKKEQISLFLDRDIYIAEQIEVAIPDNIMDNLTSIKTEVEEWLLSRSSLMEIDIFLFSAAGWEPIVSSS
jgi:hypothetical protein